MFTPRNSITRKIFNNELSTRYQLPKVKETWSAELHTLEGHSYTVLSVALSPNSQLLASSGSDDKTIKLWDPTTGELRQTLKDHFGEVLRKYSALRSSSCQWYTRRQNRLSEPYTLPLFFKTHVKRG
jgi:WD40 repeat protein